MEISDIDDDEDLHYDEIKDDDDEDDDDEEELNNFEALKAKTTFKIMQN